MRMIAAMLLMVSSAATAAPLTPPKNRSVTRLACVVSRNENRFAVIGSASTVGRSNTALSGVSPVAGDGACAATGALTDTNSVAPTMLMSTTERYAEFGVLRANGWSKWDVLKVVTAESGWLGLLAGLLGCGLAVAAALVANRFLDGGLRLVVNPSMIAFGLGLSLVMGILGGLYPAWRASHLPIMEVIRKGAQ